VEKVLVEPFPAYVVLFVSLETVISDLHLVAEC